MEVTNEFGLGKFFTFELSKNLPIHSWFYYKEGFAPNVVDWALEKENLGNGTLLDPFCGCGTGLLAAKSRGLNSVGFDISPVAVLASKVKCADYSPVEVEEAGKFLTSISHISASSYDWQFELFSPRAAFPKSNYNALLSIREAITRVENEKTKDLLMLALLSIIPRVGIFIKDGGVLKIDKRKMAMPVKEAFKRKLKRMISDLGISRVNGPVPQISQGDARDIKMSDHSVDIVVTSPPYLNNVDYSKVYGLELSLLSLDKSITREVRGGSLRSFITSNLPPENVPPEIGDIGYKVPVIGNYFSDLEKTLTEIKRVLRPGSACYLIIGNSVVYGLQIYVDELIAEIAERLEIKSSIIVGAERMADVKPRKVKIRESVVVMRA